MKDDSKSPLCEKLMRQAYNGFVKERARILKEAETRKPSPVRLTTLGELTVLYQKVEAMYLEAFYEADESFKDAARKVNKQQIEKEILEKVKELVSNQEHMKNALQLLNAVMLNVHPVAVKAVQTAMTDPFLATKHVEDKTEGSPSASAVRYPLIIFSYEYTIIHPNNRLPRVRTLRGAKPPPLLTRNVRNENVTNAP